nr:ATP synthase F0 subunit 8 [Megacampsomeris sp. 1 YJY-2023a]
MYHMMPMMWLILFIVNWTIMLMIISLFVYLPFNLMKKNNFNFKMLSWLNKW